MSFNLPDILSVEFVPLELFVLRQRKELLEESLRSRLSRGTLAQKGILDDSELAPSLHQVATNLNKRLHNRESVADLEHKNILKNKKMDENPPLHERKQSLGNLISKRKSKADVAELGYIDDSGMAPRLQPTALRLNRKLTERKSLQDLKLKGIIPLETEGDKNDKEPKNKKRSKKKKHEKKSSIVWKDVGGKKGSKNIDSYKINDRVKLTKNRTGTIRYIGIPHFTKEERFGIELDSWYPQGHDGSVGKQRYFTAKYGFGIFVTRSQILEKLEASGNDGQYEIGDYIELNDGRKGYIRYIGKTGIFRGTLVGIELDESCESGHDGRFGGTRYFECDHGFGVFVKLNDVKKILKSIKSTTPIGNENGSGDLHDMIDTNDDNDVGTVATPAFTDIIAVGDQVVLSENRSGIVKWKGKPDFANMEMFGVELDKEDATAGDGSYGSRIYFKSEPNRGIFVRRDSVIGIKNENAPQKHSKFGSMTIKIDGPELDNGTRDSDEISDIGFEEAPTPLPEEIDIGDYVKLKNDQIGSVKYVGTVDFAAGEMIGLELNKWDAEGHNGKTKGKQYYRCKNGRGKWTRRDKIVQVLKLPKGSNISEKDLFKRDPHTGKVDVEANFMKLIIEQEVNNKENKEEEEEEEKIIKLDKTKYQIGKRVELERKKYGTIRYVGEVPFLKQEVIGIELDKFDVQAHDGKSVFTPKNGHGYAVFKSSKDIIRVFDDNNKINNDELIKNINENDIFNEIDLGDKIRIRNGRTGVVKYKGPLNDNNIEDNRYCGIELDVPTRAANDGKFNNKQFFICPNNRGHFVQACDIIEKILVNSDWKNNNIIDKNIELNIGDRVQTILAGCGIIRFKDKQDWSNNEIIYGIELDQWYPNATNGTVNDKKLFQCDINKGYFCKINEIVKKLTKEDLKPNEIINPKINLPRYHDRVRLSNGNTGVVKFLGDVEFGSGTYIGIALDEWSPNGHDGTAKGTKYFKSLLHCGYFVKLNEIVQNLGSIVSYPITNTKKNITNKTKIKIGDKVRLKDNTFGIVKYVGEVEGEEAIGIETEETTANGHDGIIGSKEYFKTQKGKGLFARKESIANIELNSGWEDEKSLTILPEINDKVKLNTGEIGIVKYIENDENLNDIDKQINIELEENNIIKTVFLYDLIENFGSIEKLNKPIEINEGDRVKLKRGKTGIIKWIGEYEGSEMIGLELDSWCTNAHDGKGIFKTKIGHGFFAKKNDIISKIEKNNKIDQEKLQLQRHRNIRKLKKKLHKMEMYEKRLKRGLKLNEEQEKLLLRKVEVEKELMILQRAFKKNEPYIQIDDIINNNNNEDENKNDILDIAIGNIVLLDTNEQGEVIWIGNVHFDEREMLGIKLEEWSPNGHNGTIDGRTYFKCNDGYGLLVPIISIKKLIENNNENNIIDDYDYEDEDDDDDDDDNDTNDNKFDTSDDDDDDDDDDKHYEENKRRKSISSHRKNISKLQVGEKITLGNKTGVIKFLGKTDFSPDHPVIGVELDEESANAGTGTVAGKKYFEADENKGFFIRNQSYANLADMMADSNTDELIRRDSIIIHDRIQLFSPADIQINDKIKLENGDIGIVKFTGKTKFSHGEILIGLELDKWNPNGHNGTIKETQYFKAVSGRGFFTRTDLIIAKIKNNDIEWDDPINDQKKPPKTKIGNRVRLSNGLIGTIRHQGSVNFSDEIMIGIELEKWHYNASNGLIHGKRYFQTKNNRAYWCRKTEIIRILASKFASNSLKKFKKVETLKILPSLKDKVKTIKGKTGIVEFVGKTEFANGILIGLTLDEWWPNGHDGKVKGKRYFTCPSGRGYFTRLWHLIENLGSTLPKIKEASPELEKEEEKIEPPKFKLGDRIKLLHGKTGVVRYIGKPENTKDELIGIELDTWSAEAGNGIIKGKTLFEASEGRAYFTRRKSVSNVIKTSIHEGSYARLQGLIKVPAFNGKTVKVVSFVEKKGRWKVKLLNSKQDKKYLGVRKENLDPILDWEPINDEKEDEIISLKEYPNLNDVVKTRKGRIGTVKYIGNVDYGDKKKLIGLELDQWDPNAHNGTIKGKTYFKAPEGRGYFVELKTLIENFGPKIIKEHKKRKSQENINEIAPLPKPPDVKLYDRIKLQKGYTGIVRYIGKTDWSNNEELIGIELDTYNPEAHDGKSYFNTKPGRGYFTKKSQITNIIPPNDNLDNLTIDEKRKKKIRKLIKKTEATLRQIAILEAKDNKGKFLNSKQIDKLSQKDELEILLDKLKRGEYIFSDEEEDEEKKNISDNEIKKRVKEKIRVLTRKMSMNLSNELNKEIIKVDINDAVRLKSGETGIIKWIGELDGIKNETIYGIQMDNWNPSHGDGTFDGKKYFDAVDGDGYFGYPEEIIENLGPTQIKHKDIIDNNNNINKNLKIGDRVTVDGKEGTVKQLSDKNVAEVLLDEWHVNAKDDEKTIGRTYYARFSSCNLKIPQELLDEAKRLDEEDKEQNENSIEFTIHENENNNNNNENINCNIGDRIVTMSGYSGIIRFIGNVHFDDEEVIGVELDKWSPNCHDGTVHGHEYFSCKKGRGYFMRRNGIKKNFGSITRRKKSQILNLDGKEGIFTKAEKNKLKIGDHIKLNRGQTGIIKYIGKTPFSKGEEIVGIELDEWSIHGNDGKNVFDVEKGKGYFARKNSISNLVLTDLFLDNNEDELIELKKERKKTKKKLREIEKLENNNNKKELDTTQLAKISKKKHYQLKLNDIEKKIKEIRSKNSYNKKRNSIDKGKKRRNSINNNNNIDNIEIGDRIKLVNGKTGIVKHLGNVKFTDEDVVGMVLDKWHPNANNGSVKGIKYFDAPPGRGFFARRGLIVENLGKLKYVGDDNNYNNNNKDENIIEKEAPLPIVHFKIGDKVSLERGKTGIVKFIGETEFARGEVIGIELDTWTPAGHNGTVRGKKYFSAADGRGYFTRRESINNVIVPLVAPVKRKKSISYKLNPLIIGDRVRFVKDNDERTGVIKYIGYPSFAEGEVIGIELDQWSVNAHNGCIAGEQIFEAAAGRGVFCRRDEIEKYDPEAEKLEQIKKNLCLGDTVILKSGRQGHVKYIGPAGVTDEMIGIELQSWDPEAGDGSYKGYKLFTTPQGRGLFVSRNAIIKVIPLQEEQSFNDNNNNNKNNDDIILSTNKYEKGLRVIVDLSKLFKNYENKNKKKKTFKKST